MRAGPPVRAPGGHGGSRARRHERNVSRRAGRARREARRPRPGRHPSPVCRGRRGGSRPVPRADGRRRLDDLVGALCNGRPPRTRCPGHRRRRCGSRARLGPGHERFVASAAGDGVARRRLPPPRAGGADADLVSRRRRAQAAGADCRYHRAPRASPCRTPAPGSTGSDFVHRCTSCGSVNVQPPSPSPLTLHQFGACARSKSVRIVLHCKGLPFHAIETPLLGRWRLRRLSGQAWPPVLLAHDGRVIVHASRIVRYLEGVAPEVPLFPNGPEARDRDFAT
ncbi:MAG: hypothetical protein E6J75_14275, partial [Deltaproteobacteria bacterium]